MIVSLLKNLVQIFSKYSDSRICAFTIQKVSKTPTLSKNEIISRSLIRKASETQPFQEKLQMLSQIRGEQPPEVGMNQSSSDGLFLQFQETRIPVLQM